MSFDIRDPDAEALVRQLSAKLGVSFSEAIKSAVRNDLARLDALAVQRKITASPNEVGSATSRAPAPIDKDAFTELNDDG